LVKDVRFCSAVAGDTSIPLPAFMGYLALEAAHASLLFQAICERYEKQQSIVLTSNKAFADWSHVFAGDAIMASAALDRLLHRSTVINIRGDSYRLREKRQANALLPKEVPTQPVI
jgi:DNA replication protein DnaC